MKEDLEDVRVFFDSMPLGLKALLGDDAKAATMEAAVDAPLDGRPGWVFAMAFVAGAIWAADALGQARGAPLSTFTCSTCGRVSHNPNDVKWRYCGACHEFENV